MPRWFGGDDSCHYCILCGHAVVNSADVNLHWKSQFRAVYLFHDTVKLTGIGTSPQGTALDYEFRAPSDPRERWEYSGIEFVVLNTGSYRLRNVFLFHEKCWNRLLRHFGPGELDLSVLFRELQYLPLPRDRLSLSSRTRNYEPSALPSLEQLMQFPKAIPRSRGQTLDVIKENPTDVFGRLTWEMREAIAVHLSTHDALNLRHVSRAMDRLFSCSMFWETRFDVNSERGFLDPIIQPLREKSLQIDWRLLYHCTCHIKCKREYGFEIELWEITRWLRDAILLAHAGLSMWHFQGRALHHYHHTSYKNTHAVTVNISPLLTDIAVSAYLDMGRFYITGIKFIYHNQPTVTVGHTTPGARIMAEEDYAEHVVKGVHGVHRTPQNLVGPFYRYPGLMVILPAKGLRGFHVCLQPSGISSLSLLKCYGRSSQINPNNSPCCLATYICDMRMEEITEVVCTFNHNRLIDLGMKGRGNRQNIF